MEDIHTAEENIQKILDATNVISDNITHLSATGEEVALIFHRRAAYGRFHGGQYEGL